jgi:hypothetical protein
MAPGTHSTGKNVSFRRDQTPTRITHKIQSGARKQGNCTLQIVCSVNGMRDRIWD